MSAPLCQLHLPAVLRLGQRELSSESCRNEIVFKLCFCQGTVASSVETEAALIALLLPYERRRTFGSNTSAKVKAVSAFSVTLCLNEKVVKCFFVLLSI